MQVTKFLAGLVLAPLLLVGVAHAEERGTRDEATALVKAGVEHIKKVGADKAFQDFTNDKATWTKKDLYLMVFDAKNITLAHGANSAMVGRDFSLVKDAGGVAIVPEMNKVAALKGKGWVDYDWVHPTSKKLEPKSTYVERLPTGAGLIGAGIYR